ncbi:MAG: hypothetical protein ACM359_12205, partial [Bacillota bacterium]
MSLTESINGVLGVFTAKRRDEQSRRQAAQGQYRTLLLKNEKLGAKDQQRLVSLIEELGLSDEQVMDDAAAVEQVAALQAEISPAEKLAELQRAVDDAHKRVRELEAELTRAEEALGDCGRAFNVAT